MTDIDTLKRHVRESNAIENIWVGEENLLFSRHLRIAKLVSKNAEKGIFITPLVMHAKLLPEIAGYRKCTVAVGRYVAPPHHMVPELMATWHNAQERHRQFLEKNQGSHLAEWIKERAWFFHNWFECIHPFSDGNGRTGRLILNSFLRHGKVPWHVVLEQDRFAYYARIREFEENIFKGWYPPHQWKY